MVLKENYQETAEHIQENDRHNDPYHHRQRAFSGPPVLLFSSRRRGHVDRCRTGLSVFGKSGTPSLSVLLMKFRMDKGVPVAALIQAVYPDHGPICIDGSAFARLIESAASGAETILIIVIGSSTLLRK